MPSTSLLLSPAELSYLHTSLSSSSSSDTSATGIRPDGRHPTQFRPLIAEIDILPATNGSARVCFSDGTEAIVGVKGEVERTVGGGGVGGGSASDHGPRGLGADADTREDVDMGGVKKEERKILDKKWIELSIDIPGFKADDALPVFLSSMLVEALTATNELVERLWINSLWHWKLYVDVCSPPSPPILFLPPQSCPQSYPPLHA